MMNGRYAGIIAFAILMGITCYNAGQAFAQGAEFAGNQLITIAPLGIMGIASILVNVDYEFNHRYQSLMDENRRLSKILAAQIVEPVISYKPLPDTKFAGYVYLIQSPTGHYKIGKTRYPDDRMRTFAVKLPFEITYLAMIACENMHSVESQLHRKFANRRVNGEWFRLSSDDVAYICSLAKE